MRADSKHTLRFCGISSLVKKLSTRAWGSQAQSIGNCGLRGQMLRSVNTDSWISAPSLLPQPAKITAKRF